MSDRSRRRWLVLGVMSAVLNVFAAPYANHDEGVAKALDKSTLPQEVQDEFEAFGMDITLKLPRWESLPSSRMVVPFKYGR